MITSGNGNKVWPPIMPETEVVTSKANPEVDDWTEETLAQRRWGVVGKVITHSDAHGLCYKVRHQDGSVAWYDSAELVTYP
jgi:hypothetical protein